MNRIEKEWNNIYWKIYIYTDVLQSHEIYDINIKKGAHEKRNNRSITLILMPHEIIYK